MRGKLSLVDNGFVWVVSYINRFKREFEIKVHVGIFSEKNQIRVTIMKIINWFEYLLVNIEVWPCYSCLSLSLWYCPVT